MAHYQKRLRKHNKKASESTKSSGMSLGKNFFGPGKVISGPVYFIGPGYFCWSRVFPKGIFKLKPGPVYFFWSRVLFLGPGYFWWSRVFPKGVFSIKPGPVYFFRSRVFFFGPGYFFRSRVLFFPVPEKLKIPGKRIRAEIRISSIEFFIKTVIFKKACQKVIYKESSGGRCFGYYHT